MADHDERAPARTAFVPSAPLLLPGLAGSTEPAELVAVRRAVAAAVAWLTDGARDVLVVGAGPRPGTWPSGSSGDTAPYGVSGPLRLGRGQADRDDPLPLSLLVAAHLLAPYDLTATGVVPGDGPLPAADRLLVVADGSARRRDGAPGYVDPRAVPYDDHVTALLATGDAGGLAAIDPDLGADLLVAGASVWPAVADRWRGTAVHAALDLADAPYGVAYLVARWWR